MTPNSGSILYHPKRNYLKVGGRGFNTISYMSSVIDGLWLSELDISNSQTPKIEGGAIIWILYGIFWLEVGMVRTVY